MKGKATSVTGDHVITNSDDDTSAETKPRIQIKHCSAIERHMMLKQLRFSSLMKINVDNGKQYHVVSVVAFIDCTVDSQNNYCDNYIN